MNKTISLLLASFLIGLCSIGIVCLFLIEPPAEIGVDYTAYNFDYIIPRPWYSQIDEIADLGFVDSIIPFYLYRSTTFDNVPLDFDLLLVENDRDFDVTINLDANCCIVDERFAEKSGLMVGDEIVFELFGTKQKKTVSDVLPSYPFSSRPTIFAELADDVESLLMNNINHLSYSGAYIRANNFQLADNYFYYKYYPLGKVGEPSWYENSETYNYMLNSITTTTAVNEIISVEPLRLQQSHVLSDYYEKRDLNFAMSLLIICLWITLPWIGLVLINKKGDEALLVLGYKISAITRRYIISFIISGLVASGGSFLYVKFYNLTYVVIYDVTLFCCVILLSLIVHRNFNKKELECSANRNEYAKDKAKSYFTFDGNENCADIQQNPKLKNDQKCENATLEDINHNEHIASIPESSSNNNKTSEGINPNFNLEENHDSLFEMNCENESTKRNKE